MDDVMAHNHRGLTASSQSLPSSLYLTAGEGGSFSLEHSAMQWEEQGSRSEPQPGHSTQQSLRLHVPEYLAPNRTVTTCGLTVIIVITIMESVAWTLHSSHELPHSGSSPASCL